MRRLRDDESGAALITALLCTMVMLALGLALLAIVDTQASESTDERTRDRGFNLAESVLTSEAFVLGRNWPTTRPRRQPCCAGRRRLRRHDRRDRGTPASPRPRACGPTSTPATPTPRTPARRGRSTSATTSTARRSGTTRCSNNAQTTTPTATTRSGSARSRSSAARPAPSSASSRSARRAALNPKYGLVAGSAHRGPRRRRRRRSRTTRSCTALTEHGCWRDQPARRGGSPQVPRPRIGRHRRALRRCSTTSTRSRPA